MKKCSKCELEKPIDEYYKSIKSKCKECVKEARRKKYKENAEKEKSYARTYYKENTEKVKKRTAEYKRKNPDKWNNPETLRNYQRNYQRKRYQEFGEEVRRERRRRYQENSEVEKERAREAYKSNPEYFKMNKRKRRAREKALPFEMTLQEAESINEIFSSCWITGSANTEEEHFQAIGWGMGEGHTVRNVWRLEKELNRWKRDSNPFEFFRRPDVVEQIGVKGIKAFEKVVQYFAELNGMSSEEFEEYTTFCYENQKTYEEIDECLRNGITVDSRKEFEESKQKK